MLSKQILAIILSTGLITGMGQYNSVSTNNLTANTTRAVVTISSDKDVQAIKKLIPDADVKLLKGGNAIVYSNKLSEKQLYSKLSKLKQVKKAKKPDKIVVVQPQDKVTVTTQSIRNNRIARNVGTSSSKLSTNDPFIKYQWDLFDTESTKAWPLVHQQKQIEVAVVDTGVDYNHPDLKGKIDLANAYNFVANTTNPMDDNGHGTHVSGIIAADYNNALGVAGVAGNINIKILPVKVLDSTGAGDSDIIAQGIQYAADKGADIINLSLGGRGTSPEIDAAINYAVQKGVFVVAAAGNDSSNTAYYDPAENPEVYTVSALNPNDTRASYSNFGDNVQGAAPGTNVLSTYLNGQYAFMSGTSMAAPVASGIAALVKSEKPSLNPTQIAQILDKSAVDLGARGKDKFYGYGKIDAYKAVTLAASSK